MKRVWSTVDRWGPGLVSILTLFGVIATLWFFGERISRVEGGQYELREQDNRASTRELALRQEIMTYQAYVANLTNKMTEHGIEVPPLPVISK